MLCIYGRSAARNGDVTRESRRGVVKDVEDVGPLHARCGVLQIILYLVYILYIYYAHADLAAKARAAAEIFACSPELMIATYLLVRAIKLARRTPLERALQGLSNAPNFGRCRCRVWK